MLYDVYMTKTLINSSSTAVTPKAIVSWVNNDGVTTELPFASFYLAEVWVRRYEYPYEMGIRLV